MPALLQELYYFPPVRWFSGLRETGWLVLEGSETYQKGSYRNRCHILGPNGLQRLSVPLLKGKHQKMPIQQVRPDWRQDWATQHKRSLQAAYGKAPFYEEFAPDYFRILDGRPRYLFELNLAILEQVFGHLRWSPTIQLTTSFERYYDDGTIDLRGEFDPKRPADEQTPYLQVFADRFGFTPDLSILDLLFCMGPEAARYI